MPQIEESSAAAECCGRRPERPSRVLEGNEIGNDRVPSTDADVVIALPSGKKIADRAQGRSRQRGRHRDDRPDRPSS